MDNKMASFGGRREFQRKSHWKFFLFLIFLTAFLVSGGLLLRNLYRSQQEQVRVYQAQRRAPGLLRRFDAEKWVTLDGAAWRQAREDALGMTDGSARFDIIGSDLDPACVELSMENARKAGVSGTVFFERADALQRDYNRAGVLFANPPYGERLLDVQTAEKLYADLGRRLEKSPVKQYILSSDPLFERCFGRKADKRRKLYNGMIKCELHMYFKHAPRLSANSGKQAHTETVKK